MKKFGLVLLAGLLILGSATFSFAAPPPECTNAPSQYTEMTMQDFSAPLQQGTAEQANKWIEITGGYAPMQYTNGTIMGTWRAGLRWGAGPFNIAYRGARVRDMYFCEKIMFDNNLLIPNPSLKNGFWKSGNGPGGSGTAVNHVFMTKEFPTIHAQFPQQTGPDGYHYTTTVYCALPTTAGAQYDVSNYVVRPTRFINMRDGQWHVLEYDIVGGTVANGDAEFKIWYDGTLVCHTKNARWYAPGWAGYMDGFNWNPNSAGNNNSWAQDGHVSLDFWYASGYNPSTAPAVCGDGAIQGSEQCDGAALGGATCSSRGFASGTLACTSSCTFDTSQCSSVDNTNPTVSFSAPASGATVSSTATVTVSATDNVGVTQVQFTLDGANLGSPDTTSPYSISWDTTTATNAQHTLGAVARDAAGNTASASRTVTVSNTAAAVCGNGAIESGEQCETNNLNGASCNTLGFTGGSLSCTSCQYNTAQCTGSSLPSGLFARYPFDSDARDVTSSALHGILVNGPTFTTGRSGNALTLDGVNDYVDFGTPASLTDKRPITITAWINPTQSGYLISKRFGSCSGYWRIDPMVAAPLLAPGRTLAANSNPTLNAWSHFALTDDGVTAKMYINGVDVSGAMSTNAISGSDASCKMTVGSRDGTQTFFGGKIDELRIYSRALSASEIQSDMNYAGSSPAPKTGDLNNDGIVNIIDVQRVVTKLGTSASTGEDINGDGTVNIFDLVRIAQNWG